MACHQPICSIYWCVRPSLLTCAGAQITRFRRGCIWKIFCGGAYFFSSLNNHFRPILLIYTDSSGGAAISFFELRHVEHGQMCISGAFTTRAAIQCASVAIQTAPRLYDMKCGAESYGHFGSGGRLPFQVQLRQWPEAVGARASEKGSQARG